MAKKPIVEPVEEVVEDLGSVENSNKDFNESVVGTAPTEGFHVDEPHRLEGETQQEYNARVPVAVQAVQPPVELTYLGEKR